MTSDQHLTIIYYSATGTIRSMAGRAAATAAGLGVQVRLRHVSRDQQHEDLAASSPTPGSPQLDDVVANADDILWADAVLFGTPTRFGNVAGQLKVFLDSLGPQWAAGQLADKAYAGFTSTQTAHGGQESTLLALYNSVYHFGGILVPPGYTDPLKFTDGNPYGVSHVTGQDNRAPLTSVEHDALDHLVTRILRIAGRLSREPARA